MMDGSNQNAGGNSGQRPARILPHLSTRSVFNLPFCPASDGLDLFRRCPLGQRKASAHIRPAILTLLLRQLFDILSMLAEAFHDLVLGKAILNSIPPLL